MCECGFETTRYKNSKQIQNLNKFGKKKKALNLATFYYTHKISRLYLYDIGLADHCKTESKTDGG